MENQKALFEEIPKFDSKEELLFHYYLEELINLGLIEYVEYQPKRFQLLDGLNEKIRVDRNGKESIYDVVLLKPKHYTADWKIKWSEDANKKLIWTKGDTLLAKPTVRPKDKPQNFIPFYHSGLVSYVDVKGGSGSFFGKNNNSAITFSTNQKWVYSKFGVYVQKIVITLDEKGLFARTFTPRQVVIDEKYKTNKVGKWKVGDSKLKYTPIILEEYLRMKGFKNGKTSR